MYLDQTDIEIWTNDRDYKSPKKKLKQHKVGNINFSGYASVEDLAPVLDALNNSLFQYDPVEYRVKLSVKNG